MLVVAARYRFPTETFEEALTLIQQEYNPLKEAMPGFLDEFVVLEGAEGAHTLVSLVAFFADRSAWEEFSHRVTQLPSWPRYQRLMPNPPEVLLQGEVWARVVGKLGSISPGAGA